MVASVARAGSVQQQIRIQSGDTLSDIAAQHGVTVRALMLANPQIRNPNLIYAGASLALPAGATGGGASYTVRTGDTLSGIGARLGVDWRDLARDNGIANPDFILPGQRLTIGGRGGGPGGAEGTGGAGPVGGAAPAGGGSNPAEVAARYLGRNASDLRSDRSDNLPMNANCPTNLCCANFVSAVLIESGQLAAGKQTLSVSQLNSTLRADGWRPVSAAEARPGDVVIIQGGGVSHTEIYAGNGRMIGSNNSNADGSQRVGHHNLSWAMSKGAVILRAPDSVRNAGGTSDVGAPAATAGGRTGQAIAFFKAQGWSEAQAIGIVANLQAESGMRHDIRQIGGGPGYGLAQWEGPRQADFARWAGHDIRSSTFEQQLRFIQHELSTTERGAASRLRNATDPAEAAAIVCRYYERPADIVGDSAERAQIARQIAAGR